MIAVVLASLALGFVAGCIAVPSLDVWWHRFRRWWRAPQVLLPAWPLRRRQPPPPPWPLGTQEGPPVRRCRGTSLQRGRCLREPDHGGTCLFPVDLGLPRS